MAERIFEEMVTWWHHHHANGADMAVDFRAIEQRLLDGVHAVVAEAEANEPAVDAAVGSALAELGAPGEVASALQTVVGALLTHFRAEADAKAAAAAAAAEPVPAA